MAARDPMKLNLAETRKILAKKMELLESGARCMLCGEMKKKDKFHVNTDPRNHAGICPICKQCAEQIACRVDANGELHTPTKESVQLALRYENKPFLESVWNSAIQETENLVSGKVRTNVWYSYCHIIAMVNYVGLTYFDSDMFKEKIIYNDELTEKDVMDSHVGQDTYDSFLKNKSDVVRLLDYDPFEKESINDQPFLYSQLLGLLDSSEDANDDMMRTSSCITIVRGFLQQSKIDDSIAKLMGDINNLEKNAGTIKALQDSKSKITGIIKDLAAESCISLKNTKNAKKGENTWTGKIKKIKDLNLREGEVNGFDIWTCKGMQQVMELSDASIMKQLSLDESEWSDMVAEQRKMIRTLQSERDNYQEISRILLRENIDIRDYMDENNVDYKNLIDLDNLYSVFSSDYEEVDFNVESDQSESES